MPYKDPENRRARDRQRRREGRCRGNKQTPEYAAYTQAKSRCQSPTNSKYKDYGAQGVEFLFTSFGKFLEHVGPRPSRGHSLDRIDTLGHYARGNVRWATSDEQNANKRFRPLAFSRRECIALYSGPLSFGS